MKTRLSKELACLASAKYQHKYISHGTKNEYVLPEELLDVVQGTISTILANETLSKAYSQQQLVALHRFAAIAKSAYEAIPFEKDIGAIEIVESNEDWKKVRDAAGRCLITLEIDIKDWEESIKLND